MCGIDIQLKILLQGADPEPRFLGKAGLHFVFALYFHALVGTGQPKKNFAS